MARGDQLHRQWTILDRLTQGRRSRRELAETLGVSLKTVTRDIEALSLFPIIEEREGIDVCYSLIRGSPTPGVRFDADEVAALILARGTVLAALGDSPHANAMASAFAKIELLQEGTNYRGRRGLPDVFQSSFEHTPAHAEFRDVLIDAALARQCVRLRYWTSERGAESERIVEPYHVHHHPHGLHLIAYCQLRQDFLYFSVHRIRAANVLALRFDPEDRPLALDEFLASVFDGQRGLPILDVHLRIEPPTADWARERFFHRSQVITELEGGGIELRFRCGAPEAITARVLGLGPDCRVLAPASLRQQVAQKALQISELYADDKKTDNPGPDLSGGPANVGTS